MDKPNAISPSPTKLGKGMINTMSQNVVTPGLIKNFNLFLILNNIAII